MTATTPGKLWGLRRLSGPDGKFSMLAADQRPPIMNLIAKAKGVDKASDADVARFKAILVRTLAREASASLLDPIWAYPAAIADTPADRGLLVTLEAHDFSEMAGGRLSHSIPGWSVERIKRIGADGVKVLAWYRPDAAPEVRAAQERWVEAIGRDCATHDICFLFELLVYPLAGEAHPTHDYVEHAAKTAPAVIDSVRRFADPRFGIDVFKLESPIPAPALPDPASTDGARARALFDELGRAAGRPWVMLSAGASMAQFERVLDYAYAAGASGYLAGRAIWLEAARHVPDWDAFAHALEAEAVPYMRRLNAQTRAHAVDWRDLRQDSSARARTPSE